MPSPVACWLIPILALAVPAPLLAAVFRCEQAGQAPAFGAYPCTAEQREVELDPAQVIVIPGLSEQESNALAELAQQVDRARQTRAERRAAEMRANRMEQVQRLERCDAAREALVGLARQRRKGYRLADARALSREQREQQQLADANCR